jgi:hypothetical protein
MHFMTNAVVDALESWPVCIGQRTRAMGLHLQIERGVQAGR